MDAPQHCNVPDLAAPGLAHQDHADLAPLGTAAARAVVRATSDNAHLAVGAVERQGTKERAIFEQTTDDGKLFATPRAGGGAMKPHKSAAALAQAQGVKLVRPRGCGGYAVLKGGRWFQFKSPRGLLRWLRNEPGGRRA